MENPAPFRNRALDIFTRSTEGRRYNNGIVLRGGSYYSNNYPRPYFSSGYCYYPHYASTFDVSISFFSPYYYYDPCPRYIYRRQCFYTPPSLIYIEVPIYVGDEARGYDSDRDDYYLSRNYRYEDREPGLDRAIDDIRESFRSGNIEPLVQLTDPQVRIAIFHKGKYEYSLAPSDYLDMTRDALHTTDTIALDLYRVRKRAAGVFVVSGRHEYRDREGRHRVVFVSFVLERLYNRWTLTQVGTSPDRIREF